MQRDSKIISAVLAIGILTGSAFILIGLVMFLSAHAGMNMHALLKTNFQFPHSLASLANALTHGQSLGFIMLGILCIILTPVLRVATSVLLFRRQHDKPMTIVTVIVLCILLSSFIVGMLFQ